MDCLYCVCVFFFYLVNVYITCVFDELYNMCLFSRDIPLFVPTIIMLLGLQCFFF